MKNVVSLLCLMLLSGCAFLSKDTLLEASSSQWKVENHHRLHQSFTYECADGQVYNLWINSLLARKSKVYFIFFIVPVHFGGAEAIDYAYSGIRVSAEPRGKSMKCSTNDMKIVADTFEIYPNQVLENTLNNTYCDYLWDYPISVSGEFLLVLNDIQNCAVPSIKFEYETSTNYNYEHGPW